MIVSRGIFVAAIFTGLKFFFAPLEQKSKLRQQALEKSQLGAQPLLGAVDLQQPLLDRICDLQRVADRV